MKFLELLSALQNSHLGKPRKFPWYCEMIKNVDNFFDLFFDFNFFFPPGHCIGHIVPQVSKTLKKMAFPNFGVFKILHFSINSRIMGPRIGIRRCIFL